MPRIGAIALVVLALLTGCTAALDPDDLDDEIRALPGIVAVGHAGDAHLSVTVAETADADTVLDAARAAHDLATRADWSGDVVFVREGAALDPDTDLSTPIPWEHEVYPADPDVVADALRTLLALEAMPDVVRVSIGADGWPSVALGSLETFADSFHALVALPEFADGGTFDYVGESPRLHVVYLAERMSVEAVDSVIRIAVEHPLAEVELQSLTDPGARWPQLYVARLSPDEVLAVAAQLRDPALADADLEGYPIPFFLTTLGPDGPVETTGTFGDVPL